MNRITTFETTTVVMNQLLTVNGDWQMLTNNIAGTGATIEVLDSMTGGSNRFYRLGVAKN
jgi:hypothetical protein